MRRKHGMPALTSATLSPLSAVNRMATYYCSRSILYLSEDEDAPRLVVSGRFIDRKMRSALGVGRPESEVWRGTRA
jgi:hypothetical protein